LGYIDNKNELFPMKNLPSFKDFSNYSSLLETASAEEIRLLNELETSDPNHTLNEGKILDTVKNELSKFFLGKYSKLSVIDKARKVLVDLEIDLIEKKYEFEESISNIDSQIDSIGSSGDKQRLIALRKDRDNKIKEFEKYEESSKLKMKKAIEVIREMIEGDSRKRKYYEAGRSEDEIGLAELKYKFAKEKSDDKEIKKYEEAIRKAKEEAEAKADVLKSEIETKEKDSEPEASNQVQVVKIDPEKEKKKISSRRGKDIIERKRQLENSIVDLKADMERILTQMEKHIKSGKKISRSYINNKKIQLLSMASSIDSQTNLLKILRDLGKSENEITKKLSKEQEFTKLANLINQGIAEGEDAKSGLKKVVSSIFVGPEGTINTEKVKQAKEKLNK
jgi:hypothetical protein